MPKFRYIGEYPAGKTSIEAYGKHLFSPGVEVELPLPLAIKARGNRFFEEVLPPVEPKTAQPSKEELLAIAKQHNIEVDGRWSYERISEAVIAHSKGSE